MTRVAEWAKALAIHHGISTPEKAALVGLVHDVAKYLDPDSIQELGLPDSEIHRRLFETHRPIWHAFVGAHMVRHAGVSRSRDCLGAIRWHTTGRANMTPLEELIFVADFSEPGRAFPLAKAVAELAKKNIGHAAAAVAWHLVEKIPKPTCHWRTASCAKFYEESLSKKDATMVRTMVTTNS